MKTYSKEVLDKLANENHECIIIFNDGDVSAGILSNKTGASPYHLVPFSINQGGIGFKRSHVKKIVLFNGLVYPKSENEPHKVLDIIELSDLINRAGYEFI